MQEAKVPSRLVPEPAPARPAVSPPLAFAIMIAVIAAIGTIIFLTRPEAPAAPTNPTTQQQPPDFSLTNEEAITRFEELNSTLNLAYEQRDASLLGSIYTSDSPAVDVAVTEIQQLLRDKVLDKSTYRTLEIRIISNEEDEIVLRERVAIRSRFESIKGQNLTRGHSRSTQVVLWTLQPQDSVWLIHDSVIKKSTLNA